MRTALLMMDRSCINLNCLLLCWSLWISFLYCIAGLLCDSLGTKYQVIKHLEIESPVPSGERSHSNVASYYMFFGCSGDQPLKIRYAGYRTDMAYIGRVVKGHMIIREVKTKANQKYLVINWEQIKSTSSIFLTQQRNKTECGERRWWEMVSVKSVSSPAGRLPLTQETHWAPPRPRSQHLSKHLHSRRYLSLQEVSPGEILSSCLQMGFINIFPALNTHITLAPEKTNFLCLRIIFHSQ